MREKILWNRKFLEKMYSYCTKRIDAHRKKPQLKVEKEDGPSIYMYIFIYK